MNKSDLKPVLNKKKSLAKIAKHRRPSLHSVISQSSSETISIARESSSSEETAPITDGTTETLSIARESGSGEETAPITNGTTEMPNVHRQQNETGRDLSFLVNKNYEFFESSNDDVSYSNKSTVALNCSTSDNQSESTTSLISNSSFLPSITTFDARKRSYLAGCVSGHQSLLGINELSRYFPERKVRVFVGTWNMNGKSPDFLDDFLLPNDIVYLPDIYAIGTQESLVDKKEWEIKIQATIGPSHVLFHSVVIGVLYLTVFMRRDLVWFCSVPEQSYFATRPVTSIKTKGAAAIGFVFFGTSMLFVVSHLSAHDHKLKEREMEYVKIKNNLDLPKILTMKTQYFRKDVTARYDSVFWFGDLNYRLTADRATIVKMLDDPTKDASKKLMHGDQLTNEMKIGNVFYGFHEAPIRFRPTYRYDVNTDDFDTSGKFRTPAYTDRILFRCRRRNSIKCLLYNSAPSIRTSDHKPVYGLYDVAIRPGTDNIPLSAGLFDRDVYLQAIKQRSLHLVSDSSKTSAVCSVM